MTACDRLRPLRKFIFTSSNGITHTFPRARPPSLPPSLATSVQSIDGKTYRNCLLHKILALAMACWLLFTRKWAQEQDSSVTGHRLSKTKQYTACKHKWLVASNLGLSLLGTINTHFVSFHWI